MKKHIILAITAAEAFLSFSHAQNDPTWNKLGVLMKDGEWAETAHFSNGLPSPDKDLIFNARWGRILGNSTLEVNNLRIMTVSDKSFIQTVANGGAGTINQEDLIFSGDFDYNTYVAPNLIVNGNITVEKGTASDNIEVFIGSGEHKAGFAHVKVGGDVDLGNVKNLRFAGSHTEKYGENNYAVDIGGVVRMNESEYQRLIVNRYGGSASRNSGKYDDMTLHMFLRFGGLDGLGVVCNNDPGAVKSTIVFQAQEGKTFQGGDWTGKIRADSVYNDANKYSEMKFIMDDTSGGGNKQILRLNPMGSGDTAVSDLNFEIRNGTLGLVMTDYSIKAKNISISGGVLEIAEPSKETTEFGSGVVYADNLDITGGEIMFTLTYEGGSFYSDHIEATNVTGRNGTFVIDLDENVFSIGNEIEETEVVLLYAISGDKSYDWNSSKLKITLGGVEVYLDKAFLTQSGDSLSATIGGVIAVPEPAEVAALLGLLSLSFAAYRRRK